MIHFIADAGKLAEGLATAVGAVETKTTMPILSRVLITAEGGRLRLCATDLEVSLETTVEASVKESGAIAVPAKALLEYVRKLSGDVTCKGTANERLSVTCGGSRSTLAGNAAGEFPNIPAVQGECLIVVDHKELSRMIVATDRIMTANSMGTIQGGKLAVKRGSAALSSFSNTRGCLSECTGEGDGEGRGVLSARALGVLRKSLGGKVSVFIDGNLMFFVSESGTLTARVMDTSFPDVRRVVSMKMTGHFSVQRKELAAALDRVQGFANDKDAPSVSLKLDGGSMLISAAGIDKGEAVDTVRVLESSGPYEHQFNAQFFADGIAFLEDDAVRIETMDNGVIRTSGNGTTYMCSPVVRK